MPVGGPHERGRRRGGPSLGDPASPQMGGSEGMAGGGPGVGAPAGEVHEITMPKLGETVTEGTIGSWLKQVGDQVEFDDPLFEVSTDKVDSEIPSPYDGVAAGDPGPAGETVPVGTALARIGEPGGGRRRRPAGGTAVSGSGPAAVGAPTAPAGSAERRRPRPRRPRWTATAGCCRRWCAGSSPRPGSTSPRSPAPARAGGSGGRTSSRRSRTAGAPRPRHRPPRRTGAPAAAPAPAAPPARPRPGRGGPAGRRRPARRGRRAVPDAARRRRRDEARRRRIAASVWTSVEVDFDNVEQVRAKHKDRFKKETGASLSLPAVRLPGGGRRAAGVSRPSTPRSTSRRRR